MFQGLFGIIPEALGSIASSLGIIAHSERMARKCLGMVLKQGREA
jgi:hypothetical protein